MVKVDKYDEPDELYYEKDHGWLRIEGDKVRVGLDDFGQQAAGKILFVRLRPIGKVVKQGKSIGSIESGKYVGALRSPVSGKIAEVNEKVLKDPTLINSDPYGEGWLVVIEPEALESEKSNLFHGPDVVKAWVEKDIKERLKE